MSRALIAAALLLAFATGARAQLIDRVAAFVDDEAILLSEVRERAEPALTMEPELDPLEVHRRVLGELIEATLVAREARRLRVEVTEEDIAETMERLATQNGMDVAELRRALPEQGWTLPLYEQVLREQLLRLKVLQLLRLNEPGVTVQDVRAEWERRAAAFEGERRYRVAELGEPMGADAAAARARLEARAARLRSGADRDEVGAIEAGWVLASELDEATAALLEELEAGELGPIREVRGRLVALQLVEVGETRFPSFEEAREGIRAELGAERYAATEARMLAELRAQAIIVRRL